MRIVLIGAVEFSLHCLREVLRQGGDVVGVVALKAPGGADHVDLGVFCGEAGIAVHHCRDVNAAATRDWIGALGPDILFCFGWSRLLAPETIRLAPMGTLGVHPALLPRNRGRHPLIWALALGLRETGLTFFFLDTGVDSGPILSQARIAIDPGDDARDLYEKIKVSATAQIAAFLPRLRDGSFVATPQDHRLATYWRKRDVRDGVIDWRMSTRAVVNLVRALARPYLCAHFVLGGRNILVLRASAYPGQVRPDLEPGRLLASHNGAPVVKTYDGAVVLERCEPDFSGEEGDILA